MSEKSGFDVGEWSPADWEALKSGPPQSNWSPIPNVAQSNSKPAPQRTRYVWDFDREKWGSSDGKVLESVPASPFRAWLWATKRLIASLIRWGE